MQHKIARLAAWAALATSALAATGEFDVLTMNVAGLPDVLQGNDIPGDKATNSQLIGSKFAQYGYDIIHVQEDFNYHAHIYATDNHPERTPTSGGVPFGSGLNTLSNFPWTAYRRIKWNRCSLIDGADCLTPKGFTFMRVQIAPDVVVDAYNVHADAGTTNADLEARRANMQQVSDYIRDNSAGNAVLIFGDTNTRYSRTGDNTRIFRSNNGMTDAWVELVRGGVEPTEESLCSNPSTTNWCEIVDKVFYRSGDRVKLQALSFDYESHKFLQPDGNILSDHNPIRVNFRWTT
ncbi:Endonuclease/exonuclease/phosphatase [Stachybotrys elegans]|uniref:Endonuclease/exonuclease/phosphatase n=1 Tax=Stachybotrys elegans TaxID=80388 RepID=A0A8K0T3M4_9HYPO|nr:Endonuclease/exonuclease/phosphatase [Stachybotrys elegans]